MEGKREVLVYYRKINIKGKKRNDVASEDKAKF